MEPMAVGVFSASLHPTSPDDLFERLKKVGLNVIQLSLIDPAWRKPAAVDRLQELLRSNDIEVAAAFFGFPDEDYSSIPRIRETGGFVKDFKQRRAVVRECIQICKRLGIGAIGGHAGFISEDPEAPLYATMIQRIREIADEMNSQGMTLLMETGQETPEGLIQVLEDLDRDNVGVNFDPANILLYGVGEPVEAARKLGRHILSVHAKDATPSGQRDVWGKEQLLGNGAVNYRHLLRTLRDGGFTGPLIIECEMGGDPLHDVGHARDRLRTCLTQMGKE